MVWGKYVCVCCVDLLCPLGLTSIHWKCLCMRVLCKFHYNLYEGACIFSRVLYVLMLSIYKYPLIYLSSFAPPLLLLLLVPFFLLFIEVFLSYILLYADLIYVVGGGVLFVVGMGDHFYWSYFKWQLEERKTHKLPF